MAAVAHTQEVLDDGEDQVEADPIRSDDESPDNDHEGSELLVQAELWESLFADELGAASQQEERGQKVVVPENAFQDVPPPAQSSNYVPDVVLDDETVLPAEPQEGAPQPAAGADEQDAVPVPLVPLLVQAAPQRGQVTPAVAIIHLPGGKLAFHASKNGFEAICSRHASCSLSRTRNARMGLNSMGYPMGGRLVGLLARWLCDETCESKQAHKRYATIALYDLASRRAARQLVAQQPDGPHLLSLERPRASGEPDLGWVHLKRQCCGLESIITPFTLSCK